jgi:NADH-quinone oxidoreductase subunit N
MTLMVAPAIEAGALMPIIVLGIGAVAAMLLAPLGRAEPPRWAAAIALAGAALIALFRFSAPAGAASALLADDALARFGLAFVALSALATLRFARFGPEGREAPALLTIMAFGGAVLCGARHGAVLFMGLEVMSLALVALLAWPLTRSALEAGYKYFIMSGAGAAALLFGLALLYADTGALAISAWTPSGPLFALGAALLLAGLAFKFSLAPFHMWTPDAFAGAHPAAATLAGVVSKIAVAVFLTRLAAEAAGDAASWRGALGLLGAASILVGNLFALRQHSLARMLGYSTVAHSGYIAVILAAPSALSQEAALFYAVSYAPALIAALCVLATLGRETQIDALAGLVRERPVEGTVLAVSLISLTGLPPAVGFIGKLYLFSALADGGAWALLAVAAIGSGLGVYYYARFFAAPFLGRSPAPATGDVRDRVLLLLCTGLILLLGVYPVPLIRMAEIALG